MLTREAQLVKNITEMSYASMGMYPYDQHEKLAYAIVYEVGCQLGVPGDYLGSQEDGNLPYLASFLVRIGRHSILTPRIFMAPNNREAMLKARNLQALLFPGGGRVDDNGVYFFDGGEVAVKLEKLVVLNPFDLSVDESINMQEAA